MRDDLRTRYADECLEMRVGKLKDMRKPKKTRRELARLETIINEKQKDKLIKKAKDGKGKT